MRKILGRTVAKGPFTPIEIRPRPGERSRGVLIIGKLRLPVALGRGGITAFKREGDGGTPLAPLRVLYAWRRGLRSGAFRTGLAVRRITAQDGWCDAPAHPSYNRPVRLPFAASAETMRRADRLYDFVVVLDWNVTSRRRGMGSAIFLHLARGRFEPTEGCIAVSRAGMAQLAPLLHAGRRVVVRR